MSKWGLVTLELMLRELENPGFAGDMPVRVSNTNTKTGYECQAAYDVRFENDAGDRPQGMQTAPGPAPVLQSPDDSPVDDMDRTRDRAPRPERKRLPWGFAS
ncbi:MAG: hypothetical protein D4Q77_01255 [Methanothrix sp.]|nr:MAG: hypothetical protein D4Q77_01255 [Methanothrix sp.]